MAANPIQAPAVDVPRHVWDAVNNAIHTSKIDGCVQPISLCYVAVRAALAESANKELLEALKWCVRHLQLIEERDFRNTEEKRRRFNSTANGMAAIAKAEGL